MRIVAVACGMVVAVAALMEASTGQIAAADPRRAQMTKLEALLRDPAFAREMATHLDAAYWRGIGQAAPPFLRPEDETATTAKSVREEKIAINLAGFYALEAGLGYLCERDGTQPIQVLEAIVAGRLAQADMLLLARFANATWKASQPFRSLARIGRDNFIPAALLNAEETAKDRVQVTNAAAKLLEAMTR